MNDEHLPAPGQLCEVCLNEGHIWCADVPDGSESYYQLFIDT